MLAYVFPDVYDVDAINSDPRFARLLHAWPRWYRNKTTLGCQVQPVIEGRPGLYDLNNLQAPRDTADGLRYYGPTPCPSLYDLARSSCPPSQELTLASGLMVSVPLATCGPRAISMGATGASLGDYTADYASQAWQLFNRSIDQDPTITDEDYADLMFAALQAAYHMTAELYEDVSTDFGKPILSTGDGDSMLALIWGADPKAAGDAGTTSPPSPTAPSPTPS